MGWAVFVSTPKGRNWFYDLYTRGLDALEPGYASLAFPSNASPYFPVSEWEDAKRTLPEDVFKQEYMAEFLEDSAGVFRNVDACLTPVRSEKPRFVIGCDVAKHTDFTVLIAMDERSGDCHAIERFNHLDWPIQKDRILSFVRRYRGRLILDATGIGDPIHDDLKRVYPDVEGFKLTQGSKTELIQRLIVAVEQRRVTWPCTRTSTVQGEPGTGEEGMSDRINGIHVMGDPPSSDYGVACWDVLTNEMKRYEYAISPSGGISYGAPAGYHDDCVIALALANHRRWETENVGRMLRVGSAGSCRVRGPSSRGRGRHGERVLAG
ncbi:MAG: hypothetical protein O3C69_03630 [Chloroflexi bacterium]|nr:hypothetical protein [Chloroflexota bacterium]